MSAASAAAPMFGSARFQARELVPADVALLQRFFDANPEYFLAVNGEPPGFDEAINELSDQAGASMPFDRKWTIGFEAADSGRMIAMASALSGFLAPPVWHLGLFIVETAQHHTGTAQLLYGALEGWMAASGARWIRLGVAAGHRPAERFWQKLGYTEVRQREQVPTGRLTSTIRLCVKSLAGGTLEEYLARVERDRPGSTIP